MTVLDVRNLGGDSAQSSPGGEQVVVQAAEGQHFITVTGKKDGLYDLFFHVLMIVIRTGNCNKIHCQLHIIWNNVYF